MKPSPSHPSAVKAQIVNQSIDRTPKLLEDFIDFLKEKIHHGEVIEVPPNSFLAIFIDTKPEMYDAEAAAVASTMGEIFENTKVPIPVAIFPSNGMYRLQVYEGDVYVGVRDREQDGSDPDEDT